MWRFRSGILLIAMMLASSASVQSASVERLPLAPDSFDVGGNTANECVVETPLRRNQGLVIRDRMPDGFAGSGPCRTTLRSPEGKLLKVKLDHAILNGTRDFVQITANNNMWYIHKTCAPCHEELIEGYAVTIEFLLTNSSRFQLRYSTSNRGCPFLKIVPPLVIKSPSTMTRKAGSSFQLECLTSRDYVLIGDSQIFCEAQPNGSANWSAPLPTCKKITNCPKIEKLSNRSGRLSLRHHRNENYHCSWVVDASELDANFIEFVPKYEWHDLGHWEAVGRNRGLAFYDGEGRLKVDSGVGLRYRTRDSRLKIYFNLSAKDLVAVAANASFSVDYVISKKTCPTIDEEAFPFGSITLTDSFFVGSSAKFECASGYKMQGKSEAVCAKSGDWNFQTMPECVPLSAEINSSNDNDNNNDNKNSNNDNKNSSNNNDIPNSDVPVVAEMAPTINSPGGSAQRGVVSTTEKDVLSYTDWSVRRRVTVVPVIQKDKPQVTTINSKPLVDTQQQRERERQHETVSPTASEAETTTEEGESPHFIPTRKSIDVVDDEDQQKPDNKVPLIGSLDGVFYRLQNLDMGNKQDISFLLIMLAIFSSFVLVVILFGFVVRHSCREKIPVRENPLYTGAPARRIQNVSFRPNSKHKRAAQQRNYS